MLTDRRDSVTLTDRRDYVKQRMNSHHSENYNALSCANCLSMSSSDTAAAAFSLTGPRRAAGASLNYTHIHIQVSTSCEEVDKRGQRGIEGREEGKKERKRERRKGKYCIRGICLR